MPFTMQKLMCRLVLSLLFPVAVGFSAPILSLFEGRVGQASRANGFYDLRVEFWTSGDQTQPRLFQTIEIPRVEVKDGHFGISLDAGLASESEANLTVKIQVRPFESWKPFEPAVVSRCEFKTGNPPSNTVGLEAAPKPSAALPLVVNTPPF